MQEQEIVQEIKDYILRSNPGAKNFEPIPTDQSLLELGILDSFGVVELVVFVENRWAVQILDSEITKEQFGGIDKMAKLITRKISIRT